VTATAVGALGAFLEWLGTERRASGLTVEAYRHDIGDFLGFLTGHIGGEPDLAALAGLHAADLRAFLAARHADGLTGATRARRLAAIRSFFRWLSRHRGVDCPAVRLVATPRVLRPAPRPLPAQDAVALSHDIGEAADDPRIQARDTALFTLLYGCGLRISEALALNVADAPRPGGRDTLLVHGKGGKSRIVPVIALVRTATEAWLAVHPDPQPASPLFLGAKGKRLNPGVAHKTMRDYRRATGLPEHATPHALRHSFATHLLAGGADLRVIQDLLGHASLSTTQRYTGVEEAALMRTWRAAHPRAFGGALSDVGQPVPAAGGPLPAPGGPLPPTPLPQGEGSLTAETPRPRPSAGRSRGR
jgi:integrase/recombinase XerC